MQFSYLHLENAKVTACHHAAINTFYYILFNFPTNRNENVMVLYTY